MKVVFMGTPDFSVPCLQAIIDEGHEVVAVVTQPDKPKGRGKKMSMPPVKELAIKYDIEVYQPQRVKTDEFVNILKDINPDVIIVVAFGQILSKDILDIPKYGCINVHASLLPKYRGAAPINWVIINGEKTTGVTTMYMDVGLDTGDMILKKEMNIDVDQTAGELHDKMMYVGADVLKDTLRLIENNNAPRQKQNDDESSYAPIMDKNLGNIKWAKKSEDIYNLIRGTNPWPSAYTKYNDDTMKIWKSEILDKESNNKPGTILKVDKEGIQVATGNKILLLKEIQMPGKRRMSVEDYIKGNDMDINSTLGE
jgi:methionyl-tRNA formyltransferase